LWYTVPYISGERFIPAKCFELSLRRESLRFFASVSRPLSLSAPRNNNRAHCERRSQASRPVLIHGPLAIRQYGPCSVRVDTTLLSRPAVRQIKGPFPRMSPSPAIWAHSALPSGKIPPLGKKVDQANAAHAPRFEPNMFVADGFWENKI
jgi:hypothetical protein